MANVTFQTYEMWSNKLFLLPLIIVFSKKTATDNGSRPKNTELESIKLLHASAQ